MNSSNILIGPGYTTWNGGSFRYGEGGFKAKFTKKFREITAEEFGRFDSAQTNRMIEISGKLWSGYENLPLVFPGAAFNPTIGGKLFGIASLPLIANGQDGSRLTLYNAQLTGMANMMLSTEKELWSADVKFTGLLRPGYTPDQAGAYYSYTIGNAYAPPAFTKANFRAPIIAASWAGNLSNGGNSFANFMWRTGVAIDWKWDLDYEPCTVDGLGAVDAIITGFEGSQKGTPIGVIEADAAAAMAPAQALGILESINGGNLTNTFGVNSIVLPGAFIADHDGMAWSRKNNRIGEMTFRSTVPFTNGAAGARAVAQ